jgi:hypothetical protein
VQNGPRRPNRARPPRQPGSFKGRPQQRRASESVAGFHRNPQRTPNAPGPEQRSSQRNYQHYIELARAEAAGGNTVGAENYYQYAEHYFRTMNSGKEVT